MRCDRFTVLFLAGLLAASLGPSPISAAVTTCIEPADFAVAEAGGAMSAIGGDGLVGLDAIAKTGWRAGLTAFSCALPTASVLAPAHCDPLGAHSGRAPPLG